MCARDAGGGGRGMYVAVCSYGVVMVRAVVGAVLKKIMALVALGVWQLWKR